MYDKPLAALIVGFVLGIALHSLVDFGWSFAFLFLLFGVVFCFDYRRHRLSPVVFLGLLCLGAGIGLLRYLVSGPASVPATLLEQPVLARAVIVREPDEREKSSNIVAEVIAVNDKATSPFLVYITLPTFPKYAYGNLLSLQGKFQRPANFDASFDWVGYLQKEGISYQMIRPKVTVIAHNAGNPVKAALFQFKNSFLANLNRALPDPHAAFLGSLLIGSKASPLGVEVTEQFRRAGLSHVVALSGYNLTIVADTVMKLLQRVLSHSVSFAFGALGIVLFSIMAGASATVVRAASMSLIVVVARVSGRTLDMTRALVAAGVLMLLHNPRILVFDLSFQLSFLATLGILYGPPILEPRLQCLPQWKWLDLRGMVAATASAELAVLPLLLYVMGNFSSVGLLTNVLILPLVPATMLAGFFTGALGFLGSIASLPFAYLSYLLLSYELAVVLFFSTLPFAQFEMRISLVVTLLWYLGLVLLVRKLFKAKPA